MTGAIPLSDGKIYYLENGQNIPESDWFRKLSIATPYLELPEEFTLIELLEFHFKFKKIKPGLDLDQLVEILYLEPHKNKFVSQFSSGMKQRLKLGLALFSESSVVFLDEPTSNLDKKGVSWYLEMVSTYIQNQILVICSNEPREYDFCKQKIKLEDYK